jgi:uncharacterized protein
MAFKDGRRWCGLWRAGCAAQRHAVALCESMSRFLTADAFEVPEKRVEHLPFRFERRASDYLVSNMVGDFTTLTDEEFERLVTLRIAPGDGLYEKAYAGHLITRQGQSAQHQLLALRLRSRMGLPA